MNINFKNTIMRYAASAVIAVIITISWGNCFAKTLVPVGKTIGITVDLCGVSVVNTSEFEDTEGNVTSPAQEAGIKSGDIILKINDKPVTSAEELPETSNGEKLAVLIRRNGEEKKIDVYPKKDLSDGKYRIGVWLKDSTSGIGTLTYYDPETQEFGALGHGICESDTTLTEITDGKILDAEIASVTRGEKGKPGELLGIFADNKNTLGLIFQNSNVGIYGKLNSNAQIPSSLGGIETAMRSEVSEGDATILSNIHGKEVCEYSAKILKINSDESAEKGMIIKITDKDLIEKTGGIVQGMSGSPVIQNGKLVGAVTHVFVNDPTRGYGIFIENMLNEAEKIK